MKGITMTVEEFYKWCKERGCEDAELRFKPDCFKDCPVTEWVIDYAIRKEPHKLSHKVVIIG